MLDFFPAFYALSIAALSGARLSPPKWRMRFYIMSASLVGGSLVILLISRRQALVETVLSLQAG